MPNPYIILTGLGALIAIVVSVLANWLKAPGWLASRPALIIVLLALLGAAGVLVVQEQQKEDDDDPKAGGSVREIYVQAADDACRPWAAKITEVTFDTLSDPAQMREQVDTFQSMLAAWREVSPPVEDRAAVDTIIDGYTAVAARLDDGRRIVESGDWFGAKAAVADSMTLVLESRRNGRAYGFRVCVT